MAETVPISSLFTGGNINIIEGYEFLRYSRLYLQQKRDEAVKTFGKKTLFAKSGYKNAAKFYRILDFFPIFEKPISMAWLNLLCADINIMQSMIEFDQEQYEIALSKRQCPKYFTVRWMSGIYGSMSFPENIETEEQAIKYVIEWRRQNNRLCWINFTNVLSIYFGKYRNDSLDDVAINYWYHYNKPQLLITEKDVVYSACRDFNPRTHIKGKVL